MPTNKTTKKTAKKAVKKAPAKKVAKKTAKKKAVKKTTKKVAKKATKKTVKKSSSKPLVFASNETSFWVNDGQILNSLVALRDALDEMEKEVYQFHAIENNQNDFANWVAAVLCDRDCASALEKAKTPRSAKTIVVKHLKAYTI